MKLPTTAERAKVRLVGIAGQDYGEAEVGKEPLPEYAQIAGKLFVHETDTEYFLPVYKEVPVARIENPTWPALQDEPMDSPEQGIPNKGD